MDDEAMLELAVRLADQAAAAINAVRAAGFSVESKSDESPVTAADRIAEALIVDGLRAAAPGIPVIAEEEIEAGTAPADPGRRFWLVDPLDGTREFAAGRDSFAVNVGLVADGRPVLGAVALPATGEIFLGRIGVGAWKQVKGGARAPIRCRAVPAEGLTVMGSHHYRHDPKMTAFLADKKVAKLVSIGSAEKFCRVAEGSADLYPRLGRTMEWDTAAPHAVLEAAGGTLRTLEGGELRYGKPGWDNPGFVCTGLV